MELLELARKILVPLVLDGYLGQNLMVDLQFNESQIYRNLTNTKFN